MSTLIPAHVLALTLKVISSVVYEVILQVQV